MNRPTKDFKEYLYYKHAAQYTGLDDGMPDDFDCWLEDLDIDTLIRYADEFANAVSELGKRVKS